MSDTQKLTDDVEGDSVHQPVRLLQCGRKSCGHVLLEIERKWTCPQGPLNSRRAFCPKCEHDSFYTLNAAGQALTQWQMWEGGERGIDPATIEPSPRMGPKMKARILAAKRRALESLPNAIGEARADSATPNQNQAP